MGPVSETYRYIVRSPGVRGGNPVVESTRIAVHDVIGLLQNGETIDTIRVSCGDDCGGGGPPPPPPASACDVGLFYRKAFLKRLPFNHTYLETVCDVNGSVTAETIQADPGPVPQYPNPPTATGWYGPPWLVGVIGPPGSGPGGSNPASPGNWQVGGWLQISVSTAADIDTSVYNYDYSGVSPYTLFPYSATTYNSNSFTFTLSTQFNLGFSSPSSGRTPGWGNTVPGLVAPPVI